MLDLRNRALLTRFTRQRLAEWATNETVGEAMIPTVHDSVTRLPRAAAVSLRWLLVSAVGVLLGTAQGVAARAPGADLVISKDTVPPATSTVLAGTTLTYRTVATNNGDDAALNLRIYDETPSGTWYNSYAASTGASCVVTPTGLGGGEITCTWAGTTAAGASRWLELTVTVCSGNYCLYDIVSDRAYATSDTSDPLPGDEMQVGYSGLGMIGAVTTSVVTQTSFASGAYGLPGAVDPGDQITITINIDNLGPSSAETTVAASLPLGWLVSSATASAGTCSGTGSSSISCNLYLGGTAVCVASYFSDTVTLVADVPLGAALTRHDTDIFVSTTNCLPDGGQLILTATTWVGGIFADGFEPGDTSQWSSTVP